MRRMVSGLMVAVVLAGVAPVWADEPLSDEQPVTDEQWELIEEMSKN